VGTKVALRKRAIQDGLLPRDEYFGNQSADDFEDDVLPG
jgi:hypothetical protein